MAKVVFKRGLKTKMSTFAPTSYKTVQVRRAIKNLEEHNIDVLCKMGKVKKLNLKNSDNVYAYRIGAKQRILFSPIDGTNVVLDVISPRTDKKLSAKSP